VKKVSKSLRYIYKVHVIVQLRTVYVSFSLSDWFLHHAPRTIPSSMMTPRSIKLVEMVTDFQEKAALVGDVDVEAAVEVDVGVDDDDDDDDEKVDRAEEVVEIEGKDNVVDAILQNCCPRLSIVAISVEQLAITQSTSRVG